MDWLLRRPVLAWSLAWGVTGIGLAVADVFSEPRNGPLWVAVVAGAGSWAIAGAATTTLLSTRGARESPRAGAIVWVVAYLVALWLGAFLGEWFERHQVAGVSSAGFVGALLAWSLAATLAIVATCQLTDARSSPGRVVALALAWGGSFLLAGFLALVMALVLAQASKLFLQAYVGQRMSLLVGWGAGCGLGGLIAAAIGVSIGRAQRHASASVT